MKHLSYLIFTISIILISHYVKTSSSSFEEFLSSENVSNIVDPDDMIMKMKEFFDNYAVKLKNNMKRVDKILIPGVNKPEPVYTSNFNLEDLSKKAQNFIEENNQIREKDLKVVRETKQNVEEKYIDLITKNKILNSRVNVGNSEQTKLMNDYNEKNNKKKTLESEIKQEKEKSNTLTNDNAEKLKTIKKNLIQYSDKIKNLQLNEKVFEDEIGIENKLENLKTKIFKTDFEMDFMKNQNNTKIDFIHKAKILDDIFSKRVSDLKNKINLVQSSIANKTEIITNLKNKIQEKFDTFENLNNTINNLKLIQTDYKNALRDLEEGLSFMKSKKKIILENISEKKKQRHIRKKTIENVLDNLEKELDKYNVDKISVNKYRKDITNLNSRLRNMLIKENMIFKKNKIKI
jgi:hypothetical protein